MIDLDYKIKVMPRYYIEFFNKQLVHFYDRLEERYKIAFPDGKEVLTKRGYSFIGAFSDDGLAKVVSKSTTLVGFIDEKGNEVIPCDRYYEAHDFSEGLAAVYPGPLPLPASIPNFWGFINTDGVLKIPHYYSKVHDFHESLTAVGIFDNWELIDKDGERISKESWKSITDFHDGYALIQDKNDLMNFINKKGEVISGKWYFAVGFFSEGLAAVCDKDTLLWGFIDEKGEEVIPCQYNTVMEFKNGCAIVRKKEMWSIIDHDGRSNGKRNKWYDNKQFVEGLSRVTSADGTNFINTNGDLISTNWYLSAFDFSEGLAKVQDPETGLWGYIDKSGGLKIKCQYYSAHDFYEGSAIVVKRKKDGLYGDGLIDKDGNEIISCDYFVYPMEGKIICVSNSKRKLVGLANRKGELFRSLTGNVYATTVKYRGAERELFALTKENLKKAILDVINEFSKELQAEVDSKIADDGPQKTIGVDPRTKNEEA